MGVVLTAQLLLSGPTAGQNALASVEEAAPAVSAAASTPPVAPAPTAADEGDTASPSAVKTEPPLRAKPPATGTVIATWEDVAGYKMRATVTVYQRDIQNFDGTNNPYLRDALETSDSCIGLQSQDTVYSPVADVTVEDVTGGEFSGATGVDVALGKVPTTQEAADAERSWMVPDRDVPSVQMIVPDRLLDQEYPCILDTNETLYGVGFYGDGPKDAPEIYAQAYDYVSPNRPEGTPAAFDGHYLTLEPTVFMDNPTLTSCEVTGAVTLHDVADCSPNVL